MKEGSLTPDPIQQALLRNKLGDKHIVVIDKEGVTIDKTTLKGLKSIKTVGTKINLEFECKELFIMDDEFNFGLEDFDFNPGEEFEESLPLKEEKKPEPKKTAPTKPKAEKAVEEPKQEKAKPEVKEKTTSSYTPELTDVGVKVPLDKLGDFYKLMGDLF